MPISNLDLHAARRINYIGVTFSTRSIEEIREILPKSAATFGGGGSLPSRSTRCCLRHIGKAFERMEDRGDAVVFSACPGAVDDVSRGDSHWPYAPELNRPCGGSRSIDANGIDAGLIALAL